MSKGKNDLVPELRFAPFSETWHDKTLDDISNVVRGGSPRPIDEFITANVDGLHWLKIGDVDKDSKYVERTEQKVIKEALSKTRVVKPGDLIMSNSMSFGRPYIMKIESCIHDGWIAVTKILDEIDTDFLYYLIASENSQVYFKNAAAGGGVKNLNADIIKLLPILLPKKLLEQQKIASCLSSLDDLIQAESEKLEALKDHKKGLMQQLFPAKGKTVPELRFKEFEKDGEWVEEPFGELFSFKVTNSFSRDMLTYEKGAVKNIHYGDIHTKFPTLFDIVKEYVPYIKSDIPIHKIHEECYCEEGDMVFADASEDLDDVGKSIEIINLNGEKLLSGLHTLLARQKGKKLSVGFGGYLFTSEIIRSQIKREAQGAKVLGISGTRITNIQVQYPIDKTEQKKITSCLSSLDDRIELQTERIENLQVHKKGLMQGLFPIVQTKLV